MKIDLEYIHNWMCAIRESADPIRTLDAFWKGQIQSKIWLIENLKPLVQKEPVTIDIFGGWVGLLASLLFQSETSIKKIRSIDIDPSCKNIANRMNQLEFEQGRFEAISADMCTICSSADVVINTSCEHLTQEQYDKWFSKIPHESLIVLQSNNLQIKEHVRLANNLKDFLPQTRLSTVYFLEELNLPLYSRFMIIGRKS